MLKMCRRSAALWVPLVPQSCCFNQRHQPLLMSLWQTYEIAYGHSLF